MKLSRSRCLQFVVGFTLSGIALGAFAQSASPTNTEATSGEPTATKHIRTLDGIPVHRFTIPTLPDNTVDVRLDGVVDESVWENLTPYDNMLVAVPATGKPGRYRTEVRLFATERGLYVGAVLFQNPETLALRRSVRDLQMDRDTFGVTLDTSGEGKFAYWFTVALGDSLMDGKVLPERNYSTDWDGPWIGRSARRNDGWSAEMFLPWSMMNLPETGATRTIGFAMSRQVSHENARYQWPGHSYSSAQFVTALNQMQVADIKPRKQLAAIPFVSYTLDRSPHDDLLRVGADFSWKPSPAAELAATLLPDFGSVEADDVVLNLTAQETFFPEKRVFFLEGNEVFDTSSRASTSNQLRFTTNENYGTSSRRVFMNTFVPAPVSLFNTRRIGGIPTQVAAPTGITLLRGETALPTDLDGAAKITGNAGSVRYGLLGAMEQDVELLGADALGNEAIVRADGRNFVAMRGVYEHVGASRQSIGYLGTFVDGPRFDAITHGIDGRFTSSDGRLNMEALLIATERNKIEGNGAQFDLQYAPSSRLQHRVSLDWFDEDVNFNDMGFLQRNNYMGAQYGLLYARGKAGSITDIRGTVIVNGKVNVSDHYLVDGGVFWRNSMVLPGRNQVRTGIGFRPAGYEDRDSRGNGAYRTADRTWTELLLGTDASKRVSLSFNLGAQQENLGGWSYLYGIGATWRPTDGMSVDLDVKYRDRHGWMVYQGARNFGRYDASELQPALKVNWFVTAAHQLGVTVQWVGARADERGFFAVPAGDGDLVPAVRTRPDYDFTVSQFTMQARYRWEIAPLTDFYLVYNRGNALPNRFDASFSDLWSETYHTPTSDNIVAKLRWRFSN